MKDLSQVYIIYFFVRVKHFPHQKKSVGVSKHIIQISQSYEHEHVHMKY